MGLLGLISALLGRITKSQRMRKALLLVICFLVFLFVLQAKTAVYSTKSEVKATPTTASKLWVDGHKWEARSVDSSTAILFLMASLFLLSLYRRPEWRAQRVRQQAFHPRLASRQHLQRFLRPPPVV
jgi:hypothetical protein